jgi:hypothetical protein
LFISKYPVAGTAAAMVILLVALVKLEIGGVSFKVMVCISVSIFSMVYETGASSGNEVSHEVHETPDLM